MKTLPPPGWPAVSIAEAHARLTAPGSLFETEKILIRGIETTIWKHCPTTLSQVFSNARTFADREFVVYENDRATFASFGRAVLVLAHELQLQGVRKGDRVAVVMRNLPEWPVAFFAAALCGAIVTPLNAWWTGAELQYGLADSGTKIAIADAERYQRIAEFIGDCPDLQRIYVARAGSVPLASRAVELEHTIGVVNDWGKLSERPWPDVSLDPEDDATIFYTSGTTGKPKGALGTHRNITSTIWTAMAAIARAFLRRGEMWPAPETVPQRVTLLSVPFFHVTGCISTLVPTVNNGNKLVLMRKWDAEAALQLIERERVTVTGGVPTIAWQLIEHPQRSGYDLSSLEMLAYGGAPSAPELVRRIAEVCPKSKPGNGWGMTETSAAGASHSSEDYIHRPDSCGPAAAICEMKIMSADGERELPVGEVGELWVKGVMVLKEYWRNPEATARTFVDGWVRTGDVARLDEEGFCYIVDRAKDMLIRGGENIYCVEVENVLYEHPAVMDAALVGLPHRTLGEEPAAVVYLSPDAVVTEEEIRAFVAARLAAFKVPVKVLFWNEMLPRNAAGKILKSELKRRFGS